MLAPGKILKAEKWWNDKAPPVLGLAYYLLATGVQVVSVFRCLLAMLAFITAFIGVAGFGHVLNDLGDMEVDSSAGKPNTMQGKRLLHIILLIGALLAMACLPWLILPANRWNLSLIGLQLLLLVAYAAPPLRLKVRPAAGILNDALYAYTVPMLITWTTWSQLGGRAKPQPFLLAVLILWSLCAGLKGILMHQVIDAANDAVSGLETFVTRYGRARTLWVLSRVVVPSETGFFFLMTVAFSRALPYYLVAVVLIFCWRTFQLIRLWDVRIELPWRLSHEQIVTIYGYQFLGQFYTEWFPVLMLGALSFRSPGYLVLAGIHLLLFKSGPGHFRNDLKSLPWAISKMRYRRV